MAYRSTHTGPQIDDAVDKVLGNVDQQMLAPILSDPAGQAVSAGQYFIYNDVLRKAVQGFSSSTSAATFTGATYSTVVSNGGLNDLKSALSLSTIATLVDTSVPASSDTSWHTASGTIDMTYKSYLILCGSVGTISTSTSITKDELSLLTNSVPSYFSAKLYAYWDANNLGEVTVFNGNWYAQAKTQDFAFGVKILGMK